MTREEKKRLWSITIDKIRLYKTMAVVEWKDSRKTKHSLANVVMFGGDEGSYTATPDLIELSRIVS